jgi:hypothetical protein
MPWEVLMLTVGVALIVVPGSADQPECRSVRLFLLPTCDCAKRAQHSVESCHDEDLSRHTRIRGGWRNPRGNKARLVALGIYVIGLLVNTALAILIMQLPAAQ